MSTAGQRLRAIRERLGYTIRDVETASESIAARRGSDEYILNLSRLSDIETKGVLPSIFRVYSMAAIYRLDVREILQLYGIDSDHASHEEVPLLPARTYKVAGLPTTHIKAPVRIDPQFNLSQTTNIGRMIQKWGVLPLSFLEQFAEDDFTYAYIGSDDFTMFPILLPGSFVRVDEKKDRVVDGMWRSEYERPIYFVETREGFACCWCTVRGSSIVLQPHPLSPAVPRTMKFPQEAEVIGQVVGIAMSLDCSHPAAAKMHSLLS